VGEGLVSSLTFDFGGAHVLVTGGTSGIGHAIAHAFADAGAHVTVTGTNDDASAYGDADGFVPVIVTCAPASQNARATA
jgi:NAD(P)-dependent dehydrogenase (short-subunit alcohol dehydrogenase family)